MELKSKNGLRCRIGLVFLSLLAIGTVPSVSVAEGMNSTSQSLTNVKKFPYPDRIRYDSHCLTIDGKDTLICSAEFHYFRTPHELWRDRFRKIKEAGFNTVDTYVPWNWHECDMPA